MKNMTLGNIADACGGIYHGTEAAKEKIAIKIDLNNLLPIFLYPFHKYNKHDKCLNFID